jgi:hypothetical protein
MLLVNTYNSSSSLAYRTVGSGSLEDQRDILTNMGSDEHQTFIASIVTATQSFLVALVDNSHHTLLRMQRVIIALPAR